MHIKLKENSDNKCEREKKWILLISAIRFVLSFFISLDKPPKKNIYIRQAQTNCPQMKNVLAYISIM